MTQASVDYIKGKLTLKKMRELCLRHGISTLRYNGHLIDLSAQLSVINASGSVTGNEQLGRAQQVRVTYPKSEDNKFPVIVWEWADHFRDYLSSDPFNGKDVIAWRVELSREIPGIIPIRKNGHGYWTYVLLVRDGLILDKRIDVNKELRRRSASKGWKPGKLCL